MPFYPSLPRWGKTGTETQSVFPAGNITLGGGRGVMRRGKNGSSRRRPLPVRKKSAHTVGRRLSPAAQAFPGGEGGPRQRWMRVCRQPAQHSAMLCFVQSLISRLRRQLPPREAQDAAGDRWPPLRLEYLLCKKLTSPFFQSPLKGENRANMTVADGCRSRENSHQAVFAYGDGDFRG